MIKNIIASTAVAGAVTLSSIAASAAPIAFESADRAASPIGASEEVNGLGDAWLIILVLLISSGLIVLIENNEGNDLPASP